MLVTLIEGDGIGPEVAEAMKIVLQKAGSNVEFEELNAGESVFKKEGVYIPDSVFKSIEKKQSRYKRSNYNSYRLWI